MNKKELIDGPGGFVISLVVVYAVVAGVFLVFQGIATTVNWFLGK